MVKKMIMARIKTLKEFFTFKKKRKELYKLDGKMKHNSQILYIFFLSCQNVPFLFFTSQLSFVGIRCYIL